MVSRPRLSPVVVAAIAGAIGLTAATPAAPGARPRPVAGTISGAVTGPLPTATGDASVRAASATTGAVVAVARPGKHGVFTLKLAPGSYALTATVVTAGGTVSRQTIAVSLTAAQKRTGLRIRPVKVHAKASAVAGRAATLAPLALRPPVSTGAVATRSFVTEHGRKVPGNTAFSIPPFKGGSGSWASLTAGLSSVLMAGVQGKPACTSTLTENSTVVPFLRHEAKGQRSPYFSAGKLKADLIKPGVVVSGRIILSSDGRAATLTIVFRDATTKKAFATVKSTITKARWASAAQQLAKVVAERLCRAPAAYDLTLHVDGVFDFPTHTATGTIDTSLRARPRGEGVTWAGSGKYLWNKVVYTSKTGCTFQVIQPTGGGWAASIASSASRAQIAVNWGLTVTDQSKLTVATAYCPNLPALGKVPGPSQINLTPTSFTFPAEGGIGQVGGGLNENTFGLADILATMGISVIGPLGFTNIGTLTATPVWKYQAP